MTRAGLILSPTRAFVFSATGATVGGHAGLGHVPGAALLGFAAGRLYSQVGKDAFTLFHSGKVRFLNAYPLDANGARTYPMPLTLQEPKRCRSGVCDGTLQPDTARNTNFPPEDDGVHEAMETLSAAYISAAGRIPKIDRELRMKTAITAGDRRAEPAQLFGYEATLARGNYFTTIDWDKDVDADLADLIDSLLKVFERGEVRLGRSAAAEFGGGFQCNQIEPPDEPRDWPNSVRWVTLWCLSDLALEDEYGAPMLSPPPDMLGLGSGRLCAERSAIRTRRWSPWNGALDCRDTERVVIVAGSVLHYELDKDADTTGMKAGVGLYRESGLGQVWVNPPLLTAARPELLDCEKLFSRGVSQPSAPRPNPRCSPTDTLVRAVAEQHTKRLKADAVAEILSASWAGVLEKSMKGGGPRPSQWARVDAAAAFVLRQEHDDGMKILIKLLFEDDNAICRERDEAWNTLGRELRKLIVADPNFAAIQRLAGRMRSEAKGGRDE